MLFNSQKYNKIFKIKKEPNKHNLVKTTVYSIKEYYLKSI